MNAHLGRYAADVSESYVALAEHEGRWREAAIALTPATVYLVVPDAHETVIAFNGSSLRFDAGLPFSGSPARISDDARALVIRTAGRRRLLIHAKIHPGEPAPFLESDVPAVAPKPPNSANALNGSVVWLVVSAVLALVTVLRLDALDGWLRFVSFVQKTVTIGALGLLIVAIVGHLTHPRDR